MPETEVTALKEALFAQQDLLQELYHELDVEREAASSAASEALSMILRLQGEKAAIKMEANQYKRLAEEKICHNEEALAIYEDLIYQKEMEIVALVDEMGAQRNLRRNSLPPLSFKVSCQRKNNAKRERSLSPNLFLTMEENKDTEINIEKNIGELPSGNINSYWEEINNLGRTVREIPDFKGTKSKFFTSSVGKDRLARSTSTPIEHPQILLKKEKSINPSSSSDVYDVFEVPRIQEREKLRLAKAKSVSEMAIEPYNEYENDSIRKIFSNKQREKTFSEGMEKCSRVHWVNKMSEISEVEGRERNYGERGREELKMLKEIKEQLNTIQYEIMSMKNEKISPMDEFPLLILSEAMLHFWL